MIELIADHDGRAEIGVAGDTYNTAVYLKKISDIEVAYVTALGTDTFSDRILAEIERYRLSTELIERRENMMPGLYAIETDNSGERSFSYWRGQSAAKTIFRKPCLITLPMLEQFDFLYISGISMAILPGATRDLLIEFIKDYKAKGGKLVYDSNYRSRLWENIEVARTVTMAMWSLADIALPSLDDEITLFGDRDENAVLERLANTGVTFGALKRGAKGPLAIGDQSESTSFGSVKNIVDTTAAGDSFNAGFIAAYVSGKTLIDAMTAGHQLAGKVVQSKGAIVTL